KRVSPSGPVFQAGTLSGNPLAMAAGIAMLEELRDHPPYDKLEHLTKQLCDGLAQAAKNVSHQIQRAGSMFTLFFTAEPVTNYTTAKQSDTQRFAKFFWAMMDRGVYLPCSQFEAAFVSAAHTEAQIQQTVSAAQEALLEFSQN